MCLERRSGLFVWPARERSSQLTHDQNEAGAVVNHVYGAFGALAERGTKPLLQADRLPPQAEAERLIVLDIVAKTGLRPSHRLLDLGCGPGTLSIPLSFFVESVVSMDHPAVVQRAAERFSPDNIEWIGGEFPKDRPSGDFDVVIIYNMLHCLTCLDEAFAFAREAGRLLRPGGRLLIGDLPNRDSKRRFQTSEAGRAFEEEWRKLSAAVTAGESPTLRIPSGSDMIGAFDDKTVLELAGRFRSEGFHAYMLPQPADLPFGRTREDMLVIRP